MANWAVATGTQSGIAVLDIDEGGEETLRRILERFGKSEIPIAPSVITGGGGRHIYYSIRDQTIRNSVRRIGDGLDIRGEGGYAILPPSKHASGEKYSWITDPFDCSCTPFPDWLFKLVGHEEDSSARVGKIPRGHRNNQLARIAGSLRRYGTDAALIDEILQFVNKARCDPPLSHDEVESIAISIGRYSPSVSKSAPTQVLSADQILSTTFPEPSWVIPDLLPVGLTTLAGKPKVGKSWLALQLANAIARGGDAFNKSVSTRPILYVALEDPPRRLQERMRRQSWTIGMPAQFITLGNFNQAIGDLRKEGGVRLARMIEDGEFGLVVIDTLSRAIAGDQNDVEVMTKALEPAQEIAHQLNCSLLLVDHHRKNRSNVSDPIRDLLGSTAKGAMADCVWGLYRETGKSYSTLHIVGRDMEEQSLSLSFDANEGIYRSQNQQASLPRLKSTVLTTLLDLKTATSTDVAQAMNYNAGKIYQLLQELVASGYITRNGNRRGAIYSAINDGIEVGKVD